MDLDVLERVPPKADARLHYGPGEFQFGDLRMPTAAAGVRVPVVVFVHGGWWKAEYGLEYGGHLCADLTAHGVATWSLEYRRVGNAGGGWPGTFEDVAAGFDYLTTLGKRYPLDLARVVVMGHSAGGHLAYWLAGRRHVPSGSVLYKPQPVVGLRAAIALAGAVDLQMTIDLAGYFKFAHDKEEVVSFMGSSPNVAPERYRAGDPGQLVPLNTVQVLFQGTEDDQIPAELPQRWAERGRRMGERVEVQMLAGADHFDVVDPQSRVWPKVRAAVLGALA